MSAKVVEGTNWSQDLSPLDQAAYHVRLAGLHVPQWADFVGDLKRRSPDQLKSLAAYPQPILYQIGNILTTHVDLQTELEDLPMDALQDLSKLSTALLTALLHYQHEVEPGKRLSEFVPWLSLVSAYKTAVFELVQDKQASETSKLMKLVPREAGRERTHDGYKEAVNLLQEIVTDKKYAGDITGSFMQRVNQMFVSLTPQAQQLLDKLIAQQVFMLDEAEAQTLKYYHTQLHSLDTRQINIKPFLTWISTLLEQN